MSKPKNNTTKSSDLMVNNRPKRGEPESLEEELQQEKLTVSKDSGKIVDLDGDSGDSDRNSKEAQSQVSGTEQEAELVHVPAKKKNKKREAKKSVEKPKRRKVRKVSTSEESSDESSSDESVQHSLAIREHGLNAIENISTAESDLLDELMEIWFIKIFSLILFF